MTRISLPLVVGLCSLVTAAQAPSVLHIRVTLSQAGQTVTPVAHYRLLISDNPASAPPREVVTSAFSDGRYIQFAGDGCKIDVLALEVERRGS